MNNPHYEPFEPPPTTAVSAAGDFYDSDPDDEMFWAVCELYETTGDKAFHDKIMSLYGHVSATGFVGGEGNDIISQYVAFTKVYNEQVKKHGRSREAVTETIRICKDRDVLREFLAGREKEVISIMMALFDEEKIMRTHVASEKKETARKAAEKMLRLGKLSAEEIAGCFTELSVEDIQEIEKGLFQTI